MLQRRQPTLFEPVVEAAFSERSRFGKAPSLPEEQTLIENDPLPGQRKSDLAGDPSHFPAPTLPLERIQPQHVKPRQRPAPDTNSFPEDDRENSRRESVHAATVIESPASPIVREEQPSRGSIIREIAKTEEVNVAPPRLIETIVEKRIEREIISEHSRDTVAADTADSFARPLTRLREPSREPEDERINVPLKTEVRPLGQPNEETTIKPATPRKPAPRRDTAPVSRAATRVEATRALQTPSPPTIHVTIGRVEVRATPQTTTRPPAARPAAPRTSLDDYLRSRGEGK